MHMEQQACIHRSHWACLGQVRVLFVTFGDRHHPRQLGVNWDVGGLSMVLVRGPTLGVNICGWFTMPEWRYPCADQGVAIPSRVSAPTRTSGECRLFDHHVLFPLFALYIYICAITLMSLYSQNWHANVGLELGCKTLCVGQKTQSRHKGNFKWAK